MLKQAVLLFFFAILIVGCATQQVAKNVAGARDLASESKIGGACTVNYVNTPYGWVSQDACPDGYGIYNGICIAGTATEVRYKYATTGCISPDASARPEARSASDKQVFNFVDYDGSVQSVTLSEFTLVFSNYERSMHFTRLQSSPLLIEARSEGLNPIKIHKRINLRIASITLDSEKCHTDKKCAVDSLRVDLKKFNETGQLKVPSETMCPKESIGVLVLSLDQPYPISPRSYCLTSMK